MEKLKMIPLCVCASLGLCDWLLLECQQLSFLKCIDLQIFIICWNRVNFSGYSSSSCFYFFFFSSKQSWTYDLVCVGGGLEFQNLPFQNMYVCMCERVKQMSVANTASTYLKWPGGKEKILIGNLNGNFWRKKNNK